MRRIESRLAELEKQRPKSRRVFVRYEDPKGRRAGGWRLNGTPTEEAPQDEDTVLVVKYEDKLKTAKDGKSWQTFSRQ